MTAREKYDEIFVKVFEVDKSELGSGFNFADVEKWDSLSHLTLISELEDAFDIMFETDDILHFGGYDNGRKILARYGVAID
ncbi:MAG: acyl carrier protein [Lachnospiraceae bacterium]|nr:acyl carrier protein [Lachnospiraceae bacterium]